MERELRRATVVAAIAALVSVLGGCSGAPRPATGNADSCADVLDYAGHEYDGAALRTRPPYDRIGLIPRSHRKPIGLGSGPGCRDTNHQPSASSEPVTIAGIDRVDPRIAIATDTGRVYLRRGATLPPALPTQPWIHWITP